MASLLGKMPTESVPVYLSGPKGRGGRELWVRAGNSTQRLEIDDAITYVSQRWPHTVRPSWRSRIGAYLLYHRRPATRLPAASSARTCPAGHRSQSRTAGRRPVPSRSVKGRAAHCADRRVPSGGAPCRALDRTPHAPGSPIERLCAQKGGSYALLRCTAPSRVAKFGVIPRFCSRRR